MKCRNTKVYLRVLPNINNCWEDIKILDNSKKIYVRSLQNSGLNNDVTENTSVNYWQFDFHRIFYNDSQLKIYEIVTEGIIEQAIFSGINAMILAYGQTGTGKSLTISGLDASYQDRGIVPRMISDLFTQKEMLKNTIKIKVEISYIETRRNYLTDLFIIDGSYLEYKTIKNVTKTKVLTEDEAMRLFFIADGRRSIAADMDNSHISNAVFTFHITSKSKSIEEKNLVSTIHIVDLMGADRYDACHFKSAYDVSTGNLSKSQLEQFFNVLSENIPTKTTLLLHLNILIYYLRETLTTDSILRVVGHIRTNKDELIISLSILRFAQILRGIKSKILQVHVEVNEDGVIKKIKEELKLFKRELRLNSMLNNESLTVNITQERIEHMESVADDYLRDKTNELIVLNVCDTTTVMKVFKNVCNKLQIERDQLAGEVDRLRRMQDDSTKNITKRGADGTTMDHGRYANKVVGSKRGGSIQSANSYEAAGVRRFKNSKKYSNKGFSDPKIEQNSAATEAATFANIDGVKTSRTSTRTSSRTIAKTRSEGPNVSSKRRSSQMFDSIDKVHQDALRQGLVLQVDSIHVPLLVPSFNDAWAAFLASGAASGALYQDMLLYKTYTLDANRLYIAQVRLLNECRQTMKARQNDLLKARMQTKLETVYNQAGKLEQQSETKSPLEIKYEGIVIQCEQQFLTQREVVLKCQTELQLYVQQYNVTKKDLTDIFNVYCEATYKTLIPPFPEPQRKTDIDSRITEEIEEEFLEDIRGMDTTSKTTTNELLNKYRQLKQLRHRECEKRRHRILKNKKWIRSCKAQ